MIEKCKKTKIKITDKDQEFFEQLTQIQRVDAPDFLWTSIESKLKKTTDRIIMKRQILVKRMLFLVLLELNLTLLKKQSKTETTTESVNYPFALDSSNTLKYE